MPDFDTALIAKHLTQIGIAYLLALPVAWNREQSARSAGLRTFPLVSVAACGYMLTGIEVLSSTDAESRVIYGIVTGMGLIVAIDYPDGAEWNTGAIGVAVAFHRYEIAAVLSLLNFLTLQFVTRLKAGDPSD
mgnify:CR=1 FL=1